MRVACLLVVSAFVALAFAGARDATFEAFAVFLLAHGVLAVAPFEVLVLGRVHFALERFDVSFQDVLDGSPPLFNVLVVVEAVPVLVALAFWTACSVIPQALTVKFQAFRVLAFAPLAPNESRLQRLLQEQLWLRNGLGHDLGGLLPDLLFKQLVLKLLLLYRRPVLSVCFQTAVHLLLGRVPLLLRSFADHRTLR